VIQFDEWAAASWQANLGSLGPGQAGSKCNHDQELQVLLYTETELVCTQMYCSERKEKLYQIKKKFMYWYVL
jgi:hypothetical protein